MYMEIKSTSSQDLETERPEKREMLGGGAQETDAYKMEGKKCIG